MLLDDVAARPEGRGDVAADKLELDDVIAVAEVDGDAVGGAGLYEKAVVAGAAEGRDRADGRSAEDIDRVVAVVAEQWSTTGPMLVMSLPSCRDDVATAPSGACRRRQAERTSLRTRRRANRTPRPDERVLPGPRERSLAVAVDRVSPPVPAIHSPPVALISFITLSHPCRGTSARCILDMRHTQKKSSA